MVTVRELRRNKRINSKEMASMLKISSTNYSDKENGRRKFKLNEALLIAKYFNVDIYSVSDFNQR